jgi:nucleoside-diphosphate-sugar epimerase
MTLLAFPAPLGEKFRGAPVVITGAGGWIGQAAIEMFGSAGAKIFAFGATPRNMSLRNGGTLEVQALAALPALDIAKTYIFHCAFLTREHASLLPLENYIARNREISHLVAGFIKKNGARGVFLPSSGAVYRSSDLSANPYGVLKTEDERIFTELCESAKIPSAIIRVFNLAGPFINKFYSYALASVIVDFLAGRDVTLRAAHPVWRAYAHVGDVLSIAASLLVDQMRTGIFDTGGEAIEIGDLARRVAGPEQKIIRPDWQAGIPDRYLGDAAIFTQIATASGITLRTTNQQIADTIDFMRGALS